MTGSSTDSQVAVPGALVVASSPEFVPDTYTALGFDSLPRVRGITPEVILSSLNAAPCFDWSLALKYKENDQTSIYF